MPDKEREEKKVNGEAAAPAAVTGTETNAEAPAAEESLPEREAAQDLGEAPETLSPEDRVRALEAALSAAEAKAAEYYQQLLRLRADFENLRRRVNKEREEFLHFAGEALVTALLPVLDDFERALQSPGEQVADFLSGVNMIYRRLSEILAREGLEPIPAVGQEFDPSRHEAVAYEAGEDGPRHTVVEEFRRGYMFRGKVIRPALVKVSREKE
jgi:molecular chaperone GrpE